MENMISLTYQSSREAAVDVAIVIKRCFTIPSFTKHGKKKINFLANKNPDPLFLREKLMQDRNPARNQQINMNSFFWISLNKFNLPARTTSLFLSVGRQLPIKSLVQLL